VLISQTFRRDAPVRLVALRRWDVSRPRSPAGVTAFIDQT